MNIIEKPNLVGYYTIESRDAKTGELLGKVVKKNTITQGFYDSLFSFLNYTAETPSADILDLNYFAIGDDDTASSRANTVLGNEIFRKAPSTISYTDSIFTVKTVIGATEGNPTGGIITEAGVFADGTASADSGTLLSRAVVNIVKNSNIVLYCTWNLGT
jgi:hypothetical protein